MKRRYFSSIYFILLAGSICGQEIPQARNVELTSPLHMVCAITKPAVCQVEIQNNADFPVRIWKEGCFWGWFNFSVSISDVRTGKSYLFKRRGKIFNADAPSFQTIEKGKTAVFKLSLMDKTWNIPEGFVWDGKNQTVTVNYTVNKSKQAEKLGVKAISLSCVCKESGD